MVFWAEKEPDNRKAWNILGKVFRKMLIWGFRFDIVEVRRKFFRVRMGIPSLNVRDQIKQMFYWNETGMDHPELFSMNPWTAHHTPVFPACCFHATSSMWALSIYNRQLLQIAACLSSFSGPLGIETLIGSSQPHGAIFWRTLELCYWVPIKSYEISMLAKSPKQNYGGLVCKKAVRICLKIMKK